MNLLRIKEYHLNDFFLNLIVILVKIYLNSIIIFNLNINNKF